MSLTVATSQKHYTLQSRLVRPLMSNYTMSPRGFAPARLHEDKIVLESKKCCRWINSGQWFPLDHTGKTEHTCKQTEKHLSLYNIFLYIISLPIKQTIPKTINHLFWSLIRGFGIYLDSHSFGELVLKRQIHREVRCHN